MSNLLNLCQPYGGKLGQLYSIIAKSNDYHQLPSDNQSLMVFLPFALSNSKAATLSETCLPPWCTADTACGLKGLFPVTTTGQHKRKSQLCLNLMFFPLPLRKLLPSPFGCFIQPIQSGLDGMKAATVWIFFASCVFLLSYYCVFDENTVEETDES